MPLQMREGNSEESVYVLKCVWMFVYIKQQVIYLPIAYNNCQATVHEHAQTNNHFMLKIDFESFWRSEE